MESLNNSQIIIKQFLNYPDKFWHYIHSRIIYIDSTIPGNEMFYNTLMKFDDNNKLVDIKVFIPYIIDIKTARINVHELKHAYDLYLRLGQIIDADTDTFEEDAVVLEHQFVKKYQNLNI